MGNKLLDRNAKLQKQLHQRRFLQQAKSSFLNLYAFKFFLHRNSNHVSRYIAKLENSNPNIPTIGKSQMFAPKLTKFFVVLQQLFSFNASVSPTIISCFFRIFCNFISNTILRAAHRYETMLIVPVQKFTLHWSGGRSKDAIKHKFLVKSTSNVWDHLYRCVDEYWLYNLFFPPVQCNTRASPYPFYMSGNQKDSSMVFLVADGHKLCSTEVPTRSNKKYSRLDQKS